MASQLLSSPLSMVAFLPAAKRHCENCGHKLYEEYAEITDIVAQLPPIMDRFWANDDLRTCKVCGTYMEAPTKVG